MVSLVRFWRTLAVAAALALVLPADGNARAPEIFTGLVRGTAVGGYDPVAYFTEGKPVSGKADITYVWKGATWRFASAKNRDTFKQNPERYAPRYGGYCAYAVSYGGTAKGDPKVWKIVDGRLYLNYNRSVQRTWETDIPGNIAKANKNWPAVLDK